MMKSATVNFFVLTILSIFMAGSLAPAADRDKGKNQNTPPGWEQGEKTGWEGDTPPGLTDEKLDKKKKARMKGAGKKAKAKKQGAKTKHGPELKKENGESEMEAEKEKNAEEIEKVKKKMKSQ
jgi:hypothetical protein